MHVGCRWLESSSSLIHPTEKDLHTRNVLTCTGACQRSKRVPEIAFFLLFLSPLLCSPMATSRLFKVVLGVPAACLAVIGSLFHLQNHLRFSPNHCPSSLTFRKCWPSARTDGTVKSLSTAACLGPTSVRAAVNTSLFGTNADQVSGSSPQILTETHVSLILKKLSVFFSWFCESKPCLVACFCHLLSALLTGCISLPLSSYPSTSYPLWARKLRVSLQRGVIPWRTNPTQMLAFIHRSVLC